MCNILYLEIKSAQRRIKERGASCSGRKADLVERLESYDRNFNFTDKSYPPEPVQTEVMVILKDDYYKDINSNTPLPPLNKHQIQEYFGECSQSLIKGNILYENR